MCASVSVYVSVGVNMCGCSFKKIVLMKLIESKLEAYECIFASEY